MTTEEKIKFDVTELLKIRQEESGLSKLDYSKKLKIGYNQFYLYIQKKITPKIRKCEQLLDQLGAPVTLLYQDREQYLGEQVLRTLKNIFSDVYHIAREVKKNGGIIDQVYFIRKLRCELFLEIRTDVSDELASNVLDKMQKILNQEPKPPYPNEAYPIGLVVRILPDKIKAQFVTRKGGKLSWPIEVIENELKKNIDRTFLKCFVR